MMLWSLSLVIMLPLLKLLIGIFIKKHYTLHRVFVSVVILSSLALSISLPISQKIYSIDFGFIQLRFMCDIYSYLFGILVNVVWFITNLYSYAYIRMNIARQRLGEFSRNFSLSIFAVFANGYAADLWTLFIFYTLLIFLTAPLILTNLNKSSVRANRLYLFTHVSSSFLFFLPAVLLVHYHTGSVLFDSHYKLATLSNTWLAAPILALFVFGISKNCILPFHHWISRSVIAPTPVSGLLHSVAAVKSGSIAIIKIVVYIFGLEYTRVLTQHFWTGGWIYWLCGITAIYAAYRAWKTNHLKKRFAYSTISQLSYIMLSVFIATPLSVMGGVLHIISHSLCKIVLFYIAGIFSSLYQLHDTKDIAKIAPHMKFWIACIAFSGASIIGFPWLPGSFGKDYMILADIQTQQYWPILFLIVGSIINILYIYPVVKAGFFVKKEETVPFIRHPVPFSMAFAILFAVGLAISMSIFIDPLVAFFRRYSVM
jgi:multicomponent Na+:H+ antiporter subunit D